MIILYGKDPRLKPENHVHVISITANKALKK